VGLAKVKISGGTGNDFIVGSDSVINIINGNDGNDMIIGGVNNDVLIGAAGKDLVFGGGGNDSIWGGGAADLVDGGNGNDTLFGDGANDTIYGGTGDDVIYGGTGADIMNGGAGNDTYYVDNILDQVVETATGGSDTVISALGIAMPTNIENIVLTGAAAVNATGNALNNTITGNAGGNTIAGGDGNDTLSGAGGVDLLNGGAGADKISGGTGNDGIFGGGSNDVINGDAGNDKIYGDGGNDKISGGVGNDVMFGGQLQGGYSAGNDTFAWARADVVNSAGVHQGFDHIADFMAGDKIDFAGLALAAAPIAALIHVTDTAAGTVIAANFGGSVGFVDVAVLDGVHHMTLADFIHTASILV
jgi:Ca2+-binding RTX toxin-like protein